MPNTSTTPQYYESVDLLRGLAAITVGFYHFTNGFLPPTAWLHTLFSHGYLAVEAFFVMSGMIIPLSFAQKGYTISQFKNAFLKRIVRIEPAYWASIVLFIAQDIITNFDRLHTITYFSFSNFFLHIFHANAIFHEPWLRDIYWTLALDWQFYLLLCVSFSLINRREWWVRYPIYALFAFAHSYTSNEWLPYNAIPFGVGLVLFHYYRGYIQKLELGFILSALLFMHFKTFGYEHLLATAISCSIILFIKRVGSIGKFLGKISYSFYLTHLLTGWPLLSGLILLTKNTNCLTIGIFISIGVSVYGAKWFYDLVEKPTLAWAKRF